MNKHNAQPEYDLAVTVADYLRLKKVPFFMEGLSQIALKPQQAGRLGKLNSKAFKMPDLFVAVTKQRSTYPPLSYGLFIELKAKSPFKKDGITLLKNEHNEAQAETMKFLKGQGYETHFAWEFGQCKKIIDDYLGAK